MLLVDKRLKRARRAADFGVMIDRSVTVDIKKVKDRKDDVADRSNYQIPGWMKKISNLTGFKGHARFEGPHTVIVGDEILEADKIWVKLDCDEGDQAILSI